MSDTIVESKTTVNGSKVLGLIIKKKDSSIESGNIKVGDNIALETFYYQNETSPTCTAAGVKTYKSPFDNTRTATGKAALGHNYIWKTGTIYTAEWFDWSTGYYQNSDDASLYNKWRYTGYNCRCNSCGAITGQTNREDYGYYVYNYGTIWQNEEVHYDLHPNPSGTTSGTHKCYQYCSRCNTKK